MNTLIFFLYTSSLLLILISKIITSYYYLTGFGLLDDAFLKSQILTDSSAASLKVASTESLKGSCRIPLTLRGRVATWAEIVRYTSDCCCCCEEELTPRRSALVLLCILLLNPPAPPPLPMLSTIIFIALPAALLVLVLIRMSYNRTNDSEVPTASKCGSCNHAMLEIGSSEEGFNKTAVDDTISFVEGSITFSERSTSHTIAQNSLALLNGDVQS